MGAATGSVRGKRGAIVGINVTPMVDVVLVLLVIMMVSANYIVSKSLKVELPKAASSDGSTTSVAAITIAKDGELFFNQAAVTEEQLASRLREAKRSGDVQLVVSADAAAAHGRVVRVIDLAKLEGLSKFAIQVERAP